MWLILKKWTGSSIGLAALSYMLFLPGFFAGMAIGDIVSRQFGISTDMGPLLFYGLGGGGLAFVIVGAFAVKSARQEIKRLECNSAKVSLVVLSLGPLYVLYVIISGVLQ